MCHCKDRDDEAISKPQLSSQISKGYLRAASDYIIAHYYRLLSIVIFRTAWLTTHIRENLCQPAARFRIGLFTLDILSSYANISRNMADMTTL